MGANASVNEEHLITLVCAGVTGAGKSTLCNVLAGRRFAEVSDGFSSGTTDALHIDVVREGMSVRIVDTVGFLSNKTNDEDWQWWFLSDQMSEDEKSNRFSELASTSVFGVNTFLFVERFGRFTEESKRHFEVFRELVGDEGLNYTVMVFTHISHAKLQEALADGDLPEPLQDVVRQVRWTVGVELKQAPRPSTAEVLRAVREVVRFNDGKRYSSEALRATRNRREEIVRRISAIHDAKRRESLKDLRWEAIRGMRTDADVIQALEAAEAAEVKPVEQSRCACLEGIAALR